MYVGNLLVDIFLPSANSLKTKRKVIQSLIAQLKNRYNISVAEVDNQDLWQKSSLGISCINSDYRNLQSILGKIINHIHTKNDIEVISEKNEIYTLHQDTEQDGMSLMLEKKLNP